MFDGVLLKEKIEEKGMGFKELSGFMGINKATLYRKVNGETEFTRGEIYDIILILDLSDCEIKEIFFS